jgi:cytochrome c
VPPGFLILEFPSLEKAIAACDSSANQEALKVLGDDVICDVRIVESMEQDMRTVMMAAVLIAAAAGSAPAQDIEQGEASFKNCRVCHAVGEDAQNKVGPQLNGLDGRQAGTAPDFLYSDAHKNSGIVWNATTFKQYIKDPKAMIPGTKKMFAGVKNEQEINDLWAYVSQFKADGTKK